MYVIQQNIPVELKIDFKKIFSQHYCARWKCGHPYFRRRQDVRDSSTHIYTKRARKK